VLTVLRCRCNSATIDIHDCNATLSTSHESVADIVVTAVDSSSVTDWRWQRTPTTLCTCSVARRRSNSSPYLHTSTRIVIIIKHVYVPLSSRRQLRSAERNLLHVPHHRLNTYGRGGEGALCIAGQSALSSLPDHVCNPNSTETAFRRLLQTFLFTRYYRTESTRMMCYIRTHIDIRI